MRPAAISALFILGCAIGEAPSAGMGPGGGDPGDTVVAGEPSGPHYLLHVFGVPSSAQVSINASDIILVPSNGGARVQVSPGQFTVVDADGVNHTASFQLPNPTSPGNTTYSLWVRAFQEPTSGTCFIEVDGRRYCQLPSTITVRDGTDPRMNVAPKLLTIDGVSLFDDQFEDVYWKSDVPDVQQLDIRFYQM